MIWNFSFFLAKAAAAAVLKNHSLLLQCFYIDRIIWLKSNNFLKADNVSTPNFVLMWTWNNHTFKREKHPKRTILSEQRWNENVLQFGFWMILLLFNYIRNDYYSQFRVLHCILDSTRKTWTFLRWSVERSERGEHANEWTLIRYVREWNSGWEKRRELEWDGERKKSEREREGTRRRRHVLFLSFTHFNPLILLISTKTWNHFLYFERVFT